MAQYTIYVYNLASTIKITTIPATSFSYSSKLCDFGEAEINLKVNPTTSRSGDLMKDLKVGARTIYIFRGSTLVWGGLLYEWSYGSKERTLKITARTFEWYLFRRIQRITKEWKTSTEQLDIARTIVDPALNNINASMGTQTSGVKRSLSIYAYDFKTIGDRLDELSNMIKGFDWGFTLSVSSNGTINREFNYWYTHRGVTKTNTKLAFSYPNGSIIDYTLTRSLSDASTRVYTLGAGEGSEMIIATQTKNDLSDWALLEESYSYKDVKVQSTLQSHANARLAQKMAPIELLDVIVRTNRPDTPTIGSFSVGDWAVFKIKDWAFPTQYSSYMRIIEYKVNVSEDGLETIDFTLNTENEETFEDTGASVDG